MSTAAFYRSVSRKVRKQYSLRALRRRAYHRQNGRCFWCGEQMILKQEDRLRSVSADHYPIPQYAGGRTEPGNIVAACRACNSSRHGDLDMPKAGEAQWSAGDDLPASPFDLLEKMLNDRDRD